MWTEASRKIYNLADAVTRHTVQVTIIINASSSDEVLYLLTIWV